MAHNFVYCCNLLINFWLFNLAGEKLVLHGLYKAHNFKDALKNLKYIFNLAIEKYLRR